MKNDCKFSQFRRRSSVRAASLHQRGVTLLTMVIVLTVSLILLVAAVIYGLRYISKAKVDNEVTAIADFKANVVALGGRVGMFTSSNSSMVVLVSQNFFPESFVSGTKAAPVVTNQWGGSVTVAVGTIVNAGDSLVLTSTGIPDKECAELATSVDMMVSKLAVNGTTTKALGVPTDATAVATSCAGPDGRNTLVFTIAR